MFKPDFINIGTNVYRYIIRADKWMPTGTCYDQNAKRDVKIVNSGSSDPNVIWLFTHMGFDNSYVIQNAYSNDYLCYEGNCASQAKITTSNKLTSKCYWYVAYYNGLCKLVAKDSVASGNWLVIDCKDGSSTPGTQLQLYGNWGPNDSNGNAQLFNIYTVENYQQPPKPPKVELTVPDVVTVGEEFTISWTPSPLQGKYDQREYEVHIRKGGSGFKTIYTTDTSVTLTLTKPDTSYNVYLTVYNRKYQDYSSSAFATFRCIRETAHEHSYTAVVSEYTGYMIFVFDNGKLAKVDMASYATKTNRKKLINAYSNKSPLAQAIYIKEDTELVICSSSGRMLLVNTGAILPKTTKDTQGVSVMKLKKTHKITSLHIYHEGEFEKAWRFRAKNLPASGSLPSENDVAEQITF